MYYACGTWVIYLEWSMVNTSGVVPWWRTGKGVATSLCWTTRSRSGHQRTDFTNMNVYSNSSIVKILTPWSSTMLCRFDQLFFDYHMSWMSVVITTQVFLLSVTNCTNVSQILLKIRLLEQYPLATSVMPVNLILSHYLHFQNIQRFNMAISLKILIL